MSAVSTNHILRNPLLVSTHANIRKKIAKAFPNVCNIENDKFLCLSQYMVQSPQMFFSKKAYCLFSSWLEKENKKNCSRIFQILSDKNQEISESIECLDQVGTYDWHDKTEWEFDYNFLPFAEATLHPTYLRILEGPFYVLMSIPAIISRMDRNKSIEGLVLFSIFEELKLSSFAEICEVYDNTIRNGIAHGGTTYTLDEIEYTDSKGNKKRLFFRAILHLVDDLIDITWGCLAALEEFLLLNQAKLKNFPQRLLLKELQAETKAPWWKVEGFLESSFHGGKQLLVYCVINSVDQLRVQHSAFHTVALCELLVPGYNRYFLSFRQKKGSPGWAGFDGAKLSEARLSVPNRFEKYASALEDKMFIFIPRVKVPKRILKIKTLLDALSFNWVIFKENYLIERKLPKITIRHAKIHRNGFKMVVNGIVVIDNIPAFDLQKVITKNRRKIIKKCYREAKKITTKSFLYRILPLGYVGISVFNQNFRVRNLQNYGLGPALIGTIQLKKIRRIQVPDILDSIVNVLGSYRICWNSAWLTNLKENAGLQ